MSIYFVTDTFVTSVSIHYSSTVIDFTTFRDVSNIPLLYTYNIPYSVITLNTEINATDIDSVLKVIWYDPDNMQLTVDQVNSTSYLPNYEHFVSEVNIIYKLLQVGQYECVAWIEQQMYKNMSAKAVLSVNG